MVALWYSQISAWIISLITAIAYGLWYQAEPGHEPLAAIRIAVTVLVLTTIGIPIQYCFSEERRKVHDNRRKSERALLDTLIDRIDGETENFQHITERKGYRGEDHRRAVEECSVQLLEGEIEKVRDTWKYGRLAKSVLAELERVRNQPAGSKDVSELLPPLTKLRSRLHRRLRKVGGPVEW